MIGFAHIQKHRAGALLSGDLNEMPQQSFAPALPLGAGSNAESQQMSFFRSDCHHAITKQMTIQIQYQAMIAGLMESLKLPRVQGKRKTSRSNGYNRVQI